MNVSTVPMQNYGFLWAQLANPSDCNQEFPYCPKIPQYVSTLFPNTESYVMRAPTAMARQILTTVAKNLNSTEHIVNLNTEIYDVRHTFASKC